MQFKVLYIMHSKGDMPLKTLKHKFKRQKPIKRNGKYKNREVNESARWKIIRADGSVKGSGEDERTGILR